MTRALPLALLLLGAPIASAHWAVSPSQINVAVGEIAVADPYWDHGLVMYEDRDDFVSDNPDVATASGYVLKFGGGSPGGGTDIRVIGLRPGTAHVINAQSGEVLANISVTDAPDVITVALPSADMVLQMGRSVDLHVVPLGWSPTACLWFRGEVGDVSHPLFLADSPDLLTYSFHAVTLGPQKVWASLSSAAKVAWVGFRVEVVPGSRRRAAQ